MKKSGYQFFGVVFILFMGYRIYTHFYSAAPISGVITDATTGQPVEGAVVVAEWYSESPGFHNRNSELFEVQEVVTDKQGKYTIPGFKMKFLPRLFAKLDFYPPTKFLIYKYGYLPRHTSRMDGTVKFPNIDIKPFTGTLEEKSKSMMDIEMLLPNIYESCDWKKTILLAMEIDKQIEEMEPYFRSHPEIDARLYEIPEPWFLKPTIFRIENKNHYCPGAVEILTKARKLRNKEFGK